MPFILAQVAGSSDLYFSFGLSLYECLYLAIMIVQTIFLIWYARETKKLRRFMGLGPTPSDPPKGKPDQYPIFFVERAPNAPPSAKCKLPFCTETIDTGEYCIALVPGMRTRHCGAGA